MPGFRRRSVSPEHAPDREGLPLARETFLLLRGPDRACEGTAGSGGPHSWHLAARVSRERIAPGRSSVRLTSRHRTSERTGLTRRRSRKSPDPKGGTPPCPVAGPPTDMCWPGRHAWNVVCADDFSHPRRRLRRPTAATRRHELTRAKAIQALRELDRAGDSRDVRRRYPGSRDFQVVALYPARHQRPDPPAADENRRRRLRRHRPGRPAGHRCVAARQAHRGPRPQSATRRRERATPSPARPRTRRPAVVTDPIR